MHHPTPYEIADVLDAAHDILLTRGRSGRYGPQNEGPICVIHACGDAALELHRDTILEPGWTQFVNALSQLASRAVEAHTGEQIVTWNYDATDDEVFDALKSTAKTLREQAA